jgi:hypothetical protein
MDRWRLAAAAVIRQPLARDTGAMAWHRIDGSGVLEDVLRAVSGMLRERLPSEVVRQESRAA